MTSQDKSKRVFEHVQNLTVMPAKPQPSPLESPRHQLTGRVGCLPMQADWPLQGSAPPAGQRGEQQSGLSQTKTTYLPTCTLLTDFVCDYRVFRPAALMRALLRSYLSQKRAHIAPRVFPTCHASLGIPVFVHPSSSPLRLVYSKIDATFNSC
ncbi:hypothetical protein fugu_011878 [Takifugu bimaculatus]|uniref:Uncharacterized protein n=1 Tax=Takifugu bimaculatus TaxID=433685 RepID=A0A4Z2C8U1_9TELE|nr:hypothetical protein fugu_011878 [Takifugu bimaculatus]